MEYYCTTTTHPNRGGMVGGGATSNDGGPIWKRLKVRQVSYLIHIHLSSSRSDITAMLRQVMPWEFTYNRLANTENMGVDI